MNEILAQVDQVFTYTSNLRREFHRQPELGFQEIHTAEIILRELSKLDGFSIQSGIAETGIVVEYASQNEGIMHACGHDGHMAIGLTVAKLLAENYQDLPGQIKFIFQPAEEGLGGAQRMIEAGVLEDPKPDRSWLAGNQ